MAWKIVAIAVLSAGLTACANQGGSMDDGGGSYGGGETAAASDAAMESGPKEIRGDAIVETLSGNTASGLWKGRPFKQYFNPDGSTDFAMGGEVVDVGKWWVREDGIYCSWWQATGNVCYGLQAQDADTVIWIPEEAGEDPFPSTVATGNRL